jgi:hypothetical protein
MKFRPIPLPELALPDEPFALVAVKSQISNLQLSGQYVVKLSSIGNPDRGQFMSPSEPITFVGDSLQSIVDACDDYIDFWDLGGGNWTNPTITLDGKPVATISYNLRLWAMDGKEIIP